MDKITESKEQEGVSDIRKLFPCENCQFQPHFIAKTFFSLDATLYFSYTY